ncbi:MAG: aminopeptidase, partial [Clostridia bacterium]|nr:aminopeptidase [Clostridia bacterium]
MAKEHLFKKHKDTDYQKRAEVFCEEYKNFLSTSKTERLCVDYFVKKAKADGFTEVSQKTDFKAGDKVFYINKNRSAVFAVIGEEDLEAGISLVAAHIDSPRLDLKPAPVTEEGGFSYLRTHYYGGIKKYQWVATPLALYGVVVKKNGETVNIALGDGENDPIFMVTDLLPHLASKQMGQKMTEGIPGEKLMVLSGSNPDLDA